MIIIIIIIVNELSNRIELVRTDKEEKKLVGREGSGGTCSPQSEGSGQVGKLCSFLKFPSLV